MKKLSINKIITILSWLIFIISIFRICFTWNSLPSEIGVHFAPDGTFDVITSKKDLFLVGYPYLMTLVILITSEILVLIIRKIKVGFNINKNKEKQVKELVNILINITKLTYTIYLSIIWSECMIRQININAKFMEIGTILYIIITIIIFILLIKKIIKYKSKK